MMPDSQKTVIAVLDDLFFQVKIADAVKRASLRLVVVKTEETLLQQLDDNPVLLLIDLNCRSIDPIRLVSSLKTGATRELPIVAYVSHVQGELIKQAQQAGCDMVVARSAFSTNLPQILLRYTSI